MKLYEVVGLDVPTFGPEQLAKHHKVPLTQIQKQLAKGITVELEHTTKRSVAREIALDHIKEDPTYYDKLNKYVEGGKKVTESAAPVIIGGREVDLGSVQLGGVDGRDYPKFSDAFVEYAEFVDGTPLSDGELEQLSDLGDVVNQMANEKIH